ncbi:MAG TPA: hypothetical protein VJN88_12635 [Ktedonobacterales bacterium]|nr:hypothetical protein [Ktedonobacterales bacterium]
MVNGLDVIVSINQMTGHGVCFPAPRARAGVALFGGLSGSASDPVSVLDELALYCQSAGMTAMRYELREPSHFVPTVLDLRAVAAALCERGVEQMVFVVESQTDRAAAFAPIAYRSVVGLVGKVTGVATILSPTGDQSHTRQRFLPPDLRFLYRLARAQSGGANGFLHEMSRPDGLSELLFAPGAPRSAPASATIAPIYAWCRRTLFPQAAPQRAGGSGLSLPLEPVALDGDDAEQTLADLAALGGSAAVPDPGSLLGEARAWLADEWRRIVEEQARRAPRKAPPIGLGALDAPEHIHVKSIVRQYTVGWEYLDGVARQTWLAAIMSAARVLAGVSGANTEALATSCGA